MAEKDEKTGKTDAHDALDVNVDASTRTIQAQFRRKAKALQSGDAGKPVSKKTFQELNEAYQSLIQNRQKTAISTKTVTVLSSDVAEWSCMMATDEQGTLEFFNLCKDIFEEIVEKHQGRIFNTAGDAILAEFDYVFNAVHCAMEIQREIRSINLGQPEGKKVLFRMGLNSGEVFMQGEDLLGDAVNLAARIQTSAKPGGVCVSGEIHDAISSKVTYGFTPLGKVTYKNIPEPVRTFALTEDDGKVKPPLPDPKISAFEGQPTLQKVKRPPAPEKRSAAPLLAVVVVLAMAAGAWMLKRPEATGTRTAQPDAAAAGEPGHVFVATTPPTLVTLQLNGATVLAGKTPLPGELKAGTYKLHLENTELGIFADDELKVEAGKNTRFERTFPDKVAAVTAHAAQAAGGADAPLSNEEAAQKREADDNKDAESAYRFGKSRLDKGKFEEAFLYLKIAATGNNGFAQLELGKMYYTGNGVAESNFAAALYWLLRSARGNTKGATEFLTRNPFPPEYKQAIEHQRRIDTGDTRGVRLQDSQNALIDDLKQDLAAKGLPN